MALGWPLERVIVIDNDLGQSGTLENREGFQKLVAEVGMDRAGRRVAGDAVPPIRGVLGSALTGGARNNARSFRIKLRFA